MTRKPPIENRQAKRWQAENREAIASINAFIERHGLLASKLRYQSHLAAQTNPAPEYRRET